MTLDTALDTPPLARPRGKPVSYFEFWPDWLFYFPVAAHWIALGLRHRGFMLPTAANPAIT
ncbi:MAG TPA: D-alanine--D-alanine ligase, partial [Acetobacteraceae bacterium]|nr:D-alanine--D-alanine ligase [Acetobacteraceae bacterium]